MGNLTERSRNNDPKIICRFLHPGNISWDLFCRRSDYFIRINNKGVGKIMDRLETLLSILDHSLSTKKKRHLAGGILMSVSLLFAGLAFTVVTLKTEEEIDEQ